MNRAERRRMQRKMDKARKRFDNKVGPGSDTQEIELQTMDRVFAIVRRTLESEFGFGKKRLSRFLNAAMKVSQETGGGTTLVRDGHTFDSILEEEYYAHKQKDKPGKQR